MAEHWSWTPDAPWGMDDDTPCAYCGEPACERSCTGALLADAEADEGEED